MKARLEVVFAVVMFTLYAIIYQRELNAEINGPDLDSKGQKP